MKTDIAFPVIFTLKLYFFKKLQSEIKYVLLVEAQSWRAHERCASVSIIMPGLPQHALILFDSLPM